MFTQEDFSQISKKGMDLTVIHSQMNHFVQGFPFVQLIRPATAGDGILKFDDGQLNFFLDFFEEKIPDLKVIKFVPASGAASRMFKHLFEFRDNYTRGDAGRALFMNDQSFNSVHYFITHLEKIAFYHDLAAIVGKSGMSVKQLIEDEEYGTIIDFVLSPGGLNYSNLPKALLKFHQYGNTSRTAAEEHLVESAAYTKDSRNTARIHFTISPEHREKFMELFKNVQVYYERTHGVKFDISFSIQKPSSDTIAVDENNQPVRNDDGSLLFRPGGHGALLENLNEISGDLIFIKNIDNIVPDHLRSTTIQYKKLLGGYLLFLKETISRFLSELKEMDACPAELDEMAEFAKRKLFMDVPADFNQYSLSHKVDFLVSLFNRPIRVCGMVKNEGEPGGGPFWVMGSDQRISLQIVESSQINLKDPEQKAIVDHSTHFNPVDLVCSTRDYEGAPFDLSEFIDENTGFISLKSSGGKILKAQELPGLWNGAMAKWITIFAEVPIITFNPVKTVSDLLRPEHISDLK
jgi:hypothetical protein